mgnify:CR=1 FL=1|jgi:hypothetical protein
MVKDHAIKVARDYARIENIPHVAARVINAWEERWNVTRANVWSSQLLSIRIKNGTAILFKP